MKVNIKELMDNDKEFQSIIRELGSLTVLKAKNL